MPHSDQCGVKIAKALRSTDASRRRLEEFERRTNKLIATEIQRDENNVRIDVLLPKERLLVMGKQLHLVLLHLLHFLIYPVTLSPRLSPQLEITTDPEGVEAVRNQSN